MITLTNTYPIQNGLPLVESFFHSGLGLTQVLFALGVFVVLIAVFGPMISNAFISVKQYVLIEEHQRNQTVSKW